LHLAEAGRGKVQRKHARGLHENEVVQEAVRFLEVERRLALLHQRLEEDVLRGLLHHELERQILAVHGELFQLLRVTEAE
jgi:hypothetical protein